MALNEVKKNCYFLYGDDPVLLNERKSDILNTYFKGNPPEPAYFEGKGSFEEYRNALCGQSLFSSDTAVLIQNPFRFRFSWDRLSPTVVCSIHHLSIKQCHHLLP